MRNEPSRDPREGLLEEAEGRWRLRFVRRLPHTREKVWRALTEERHLEAWFPTTIEGELRPGAPLRFAFREGDYPASEGEMLTYDPPSVLEFRWGAVPGEPDEDHEVTRIELAADGEGCVLTLLTTYDRIGKSARDAAGWHQCLDLLERELNGEVRAENPHTGGAPMDDYYRARFGPEASAIGPPEGFESPAS